MQSRNASENPAGIETEHDAGHRHRSGVATHQKTQQGLKPGSGRSYQHETSVATHQKTQQGLKPLPGTIEDLV